MRTHWIAPLLFAIAAHAQSTPLPPGASAPDTPAATVQESPLDKAETLLSTGKYPEAQTALTQYIAAHPRDARALFDLGYTAQASGNNDAAEAAYRKAIEADPKQFESRSALGLLLAGAGKQAYAIEQLKAAATLTPNPPNPEAQGQANRALARLLEPTDPDAAGAALIAALKQSPETTGDTLLAAQIASHEGNSEAAADAYGRVLANAPADSPEHAQAAAGLAHLLIVQKRYPEAEPVLRKALVQSPTDPVLNTELADVLAAQDKKADAISILQTLHAAHPNDENIATMLAQLDLQTGAANEATAVLAPLLVAHPHDANLLAEQGDAMVRAGQFVQAITVLQQATQLDPKNGNAWSSLAFAASQQHQPQLVLQALAERGKQMSETPATYFLAATAYDSLHQKQPAIAAYKQFLAAAGTGFPEESWQARQRIVTLQK